MPRIAVASRARTKPQAYSVFPHAPPPPPQKANDAAFAALRMDGTVITWGCQDEGGDSREVRGASRDFSGVVRVCFGGV